MNTDCKDKKDKWDKAKILSGFFASILIPTVLALIGHWSSDAIKSREVAVKYTELALEILTKPAESGSEDLRAWSTEVISHYSGVNMNKETRSFLKTNELTLQFLDDTWVPKFTDMVAKSVVNKKQWIEFIENPGDKKNQELEIKDLLEAYYKEIKKQRNHLTNR